MTVKFFGYSNGYDYDEFRAMCDRFKDLKLPFMKEYDINRLLAAYIFGYSMRRFPIGKKNTFRRFLGGMFLYPMKIEGNGSTAFIFTGDGVGRPDYVECVKKVKDQCEDSSLYIIDREHPKLRIQHIFSFILELMWALKLNKIVHDGNVSFDMAVCLYRARKQGEYIYQMLGKTRKIVTFCDLWEAESIVTQKALKNCVPTATLQHGNGTDILYGSCSDYYLANSKLSKANCIYAGIPERRIVLAGPLKYAGEQFDYKIFEKVRKIGVVFDGAQNFENNIEMLQVIHRALEGQGIRCCIRFHPNNSREDYRSYLKDTDIIYDDLKKFESSIDICIVYNSSMYTDMIYKKILVYRYKNGKVDLFPELDDKGFSDCEELKYLLEEINGNRDRCIERQKCLYDQIFGMECKEDSYRRFFGETFQ